MSDRFSSLWWATAGERPVTPPLDGVAKADIAVVGAGIMGGAVALRLADAGTDVALVEAGRVGEGASSRPGGFVVPHFSVGSPAEIRDRVGDVADALIAAVGGSADTVFRRIAALGIDCDARQDGWYHPAHSDRAFDRVRLIADQWNASGFGGQLLDADQTAVRTGVEGYAGAWFAPSGGTLHPLRYCRGLVDAAVSRGARLFERSPILSIERAGGGYRLRSAAGTLAVRAVAICTNGLSSELAPPLARTIVPMRVRQCATAPLDTVARRHLFQGGECLSDTRRNLFTYRFDSDGRLITGAFDAFAVSPARAMRAMARRLRQVLRLAETPTITHSWTGVSAISAARLPASLIVDGGIVAASACNARGIALSTVIGEAVADQLLGRGAPPVPTLDTAARSSAALQSRLSRYYAHLAPLLDWFDARRARA